MNVNVIKVIDVKARNVCLVFLGLVTGLLAWFLSPYILDVSEPWDALTSYGKAYLPVVHLACGVIGGFLSKDKLPYVSLGLLFGQFIYVVLILASPLVIIGCFYLLIYFLMSVFCEFGIIIVKQEFILPKYH